jgi:dipeptidyl aminopeptidase/acylaminoacyl peptidase
MKILSKFLIISLIFSYIISPQQVERKEIGNLVLENIPDIPQSIKDRMFQYQSTRSATFQDWLHNNKGILISTRFGETIQIHIVEKPGGMRKQITFFNEPIGNASVCPDKNKNLFLFSKDIGGGEFYQIYSFDMNTGNFKMLTDGRSSNGGANWNNKGDKFSFFSTKRNGKDWDIYVYDFNNPDSAQMILSEGGSWTAVDWSPDDTKLLVRKNISANESYYYLFDLTLKKLTQINPTDEVISYGNALFSKDGKGIFYSSDQNNEFKKLRYYDISSGKEKVLTEKINWDVENIQLNKKGDLLAFTVNENGLSKLYLMKTKDFTYKEVKSIPDGIIGSISFNSIGSKIALTINTPTSPSDVFLLDIKTQSLERWTYSEVGGLNSNNFITPELFYYPTFDEIDGKPRMIPAFIYKPRTKGPHPVIIDIHGGPEGQARPSFNPINQYYAVEMGIAVIEPNVRGSTGYGKTYLQLDNWYNRENSVKDIGKLIEWIEKQTDLDKNRIAVTGGSYGGYMVLASMFHFNEKIRCGVDIVGISNFVTFLNNTADFRRDLRRVEYGDERIPEMREFLLKISPTTNAHKITKPLFVVQGLNDPRVPYTEAEQIVDAVRKNGTEVWYLLAKDEGHGFRKKSNRDFYIWSEVLFFEKFLLK